MTTERLPQAAAKRSPLRPIPRLCALVLLAFGASFPALADELPATATETVVSSTETSPSTGAQVRKRADAAATATLAALLPHLATADTIPLMDRSASFAGDLGRLMAAYDAAAGAPTGPSSDSHGMTGKAQSLLSRAMSLLGTPYRWGGSNPDSGFDCSGLVSYVFRTALGIELPRVSREMAQIANGKTIDRSSLTAGDLVFFGRSGKRIDHVGIYVGEGRFLHAPSTGKDVRVDSLTSGYWSTRYLQARRVEM